MNLRLSRTCACVGSSYHIHFPKPRRLHPRWRGITAEKPASLRWESQIQERFRLMAKRRGDRFFRGLCGPRTSHSFPCLRKPWGHLSIPSAMGLPTAHRFRTFQERAPRRGAPNRWSHLVHGSAREHTIGVRRGFHPTPIRRWPAPWGLNWFRLARKQFMLWRFIECSRFTLSGTGSCARRSRAARQTAHE